MRPFLPQVEKQLQGRDPGAEDRADWKEDVFNIHCLFLWHVNSHRETLVGALVVRYSLFFMLVRLACATVSGASEIRGVFQ